MTRTLSACFFLALLPGACLVLITTVHSQSTLRRITNTSEEGLNLNPSISGDGRIVTFESTEDVAGAGGLDQFRAIRASTGVEPATFLQMAGSRAVTPAISQDGSRIAFASRDNPLGTNTDGNSEVFLFEGSRLTQITNTTPGSLATRTTDGNFQPSISDDGRFIAFSSNRNFAGQNSDANFEIFVYDASAASFSQLTNSSGVVGATDAKISGDGSTVAFIRDQGTTTSTARDLLKQPRPGGSATLLATSMSALAMTYGRAISDDGTRVVFSSETATNLSQVFMFDGRLAPAGVRQITSLGTRVTEVPLHPTISGDGTRIAFATRRNVNGGNSDGSVEVYVYDLPASQISKITDAPSSATADVVTSLNDDGSVVAFNFPRILSGPVVNSDSANNSEIYVSGTPARPASGPLTILNGASFGNEPSTTKAVAPDSIAIARGNNLANTSKQTQRQSDGTFPTNVNGTSVTVNGRAAQIFFISPTQVNFLVPPQTEIGTADVVVTNAENFPSRGSVTTLRAAPGVFAKSGEGTGTAVVLNSDTLQEAPFDPTNGNLGLTIFGTGAKRASPTLVVLGGRVLIPESVISSSDLPGMDEVHVRIPSDLRGAGTVTLSLVSDGRESNPTTTNFVGDGSRDLVINEVLGDPPGGASTDTIGDANHDGVRSSSDDEFIELVNATSRDLNIGGYQLFTRASSTTNDTLRFTFAGNAILPACSAVVIFGGGTFDPTNPLFGGAQVFKTTSGLSLSNSGGVVTLRDNAGSVIGIFEYGGATGLNGSSNQSLTRSPDVTGGFTGHTTATNSGGAVFSPGTRVNGSPFSPCPAIARVDVSPTSATISGGEKQQFTAKAFDANNNEVSGVIFSWQSSNTAAATIDQNGSATGVAGGSTQITATGRGTTSAPATLNVNAGPLPLVVISQVYGGGGNSGATFKNDYIEIFNRGNSSVDLSGWSIQQTSATGTTWSVTPICPSGSCTLAAGQYFLIEEASGGATGADIPTPDVSGTINLGSTDGKVALVRSTTALSATDCATWKANSVDFVGYGAATCFEGAGAAPAPSNTRADFRNNNGCTDTDNNNADITAANAAPRNMASPLNLCGSSPTPTPTPSPSGTPTPSPTPTPTPTPTVNSPIVISEFRTRGPSGASDEFIELYNNSDSAFDVSGWKIKGSNSSGTVTTRVTIASGTSIPARGHFLTTNSSSGGYSGSVAGNQTYTSGITDDGGIAITDASDTVSDQGGMSSGSAFKEGTVLTPLTTNTNQSYERQPGGSLGSTQDTNNNANDFVLITSDPQNLSSAPTPGGSPTPTPTPTPTPSSLSVSDVAQAEGDSGTTVFTFIVSLSQAAPTGGVTFDIATADGNATTAANDYVARSLTGQTINAGQSTYMFDVTVNGDKLVEPNETFLVNVTNVTGGTVLDGQGQGTIQNDDAANLKISQVYGGGNNAGATYRNDFVEIFNAGSTTVDFATTPYSVQYAGVGSNFGTNKTNLTTGSIAPGKYFLVQESGGTTNGIALPPADATGSINLGSTAGKVALVVGTSALTSSTCPGDDGASPFNANDSTITDFVGYGNTPTTAGHCYEGSGPAAAPSNASADFRKAGGCTDTNDNAADFFTSAPSPRNSASATNNCAGGATPSLSINDVSVAEGNSGTTTATFTVSLSAPAQGADVTFDIATQDNTATTANSDYVAKSLTNQIIPAGQTTYTFTVNFNGDTAVEQDETFLVNVTNVVGASVTDGQGQGTIQNDDLPSLSINDVSANEGDSGTTTFSFTVSLTSPAPAGGVTFNIATQDGTATVADNDYAAKSLTTQTIPAGALTYNFDVLVNGDVNIESNETFLVNVTSISEATAGDTQGQATILNDDSPVLNINDVSQAEGNSGTTTFTFTVSSTLPAPAGGITFDITTQDGTAQDHNPVSEDNDYVAKSLTAQTIPAGQSSYTFDVTVNGDKIVEPDETFDVVISNASGVGATIGDGRGVGTIQNDDTALIVISQVYGGGGNTSAPAAVLQNDFIEIFNRGTTTVDLAGWSVQYSSASGSGNWSVTALCATGPCLLTPGKYFLVQEAQGTGGTQNLPTPDATGTIAMATASGKVALVTSTVALTGACPSGASILDEVGYGGTPSTTDFCFEGSGPTAAPSNVNAAFRRSDGCTDTNDNSGDFLVATANPRNTASAINDCNAPPVLTINDVSAAEGIAGTTTFTFTVSLSKGALAGGVTFDIATQDDSATAGSDYVAKSLTSQTIPAGSQTFTFDVLVNGDSTVESAETFFVNVTNVTGATVSDGQGLGTIQNDDTPSLSINDVTANEGNSGTTTFNFTVTLNPASFQTVTVNYATADGTATAGSDYTAIPSTQLIFLAGETTKPVSVTVSGDTTVEPDDTFSVNLSSATNAIIDDSQGVGTISNDDGVNVVIGQIYGGGGGSSATYNADFVELFNRSTAAIDVTNWTIQYQSAATTTGAAWSVNRVCPSGTCSIAAGHYYLVQLGSGGATGAALSPDASPASPTNIAAGAGKIALVSNTTAITGVSGSGCPSPFPTSSIIDLVGYGTGAGICFEGAGAASGPSNNTTSISRKSNGCQDTNSNSADFNSPAAVSPRNSSSSANICP